MDLRTKLQKRLEGDIQGFGKRIRKNVAQGQKDFKSGKIKYYGTINPFKK